MGCYSNMGLCYMAGEYCFLAQKRSNQTKGGAIMKFIDYLKLVLMVQIVILIITALVYFGLYCCKSPDISFVKLWAWMSSIGFLASLLAILLDPFIRWIMRL